MFSFFNKFMLRSLFIRSLFILFLPLSTGFAMKETEELETNNINNDKILENSNRTVKDNINDSNILGKSNSTVKGSSGMQVPKIEYLQFPQGSQTHMKGPVYHPVVNGKGGEKISWKSKEANKGLSTRSPLYNLFLFEGDDNLGDVELNRPKDLIFFYRRATFLFFCPLLFNSLLNFIFEIDNKPSGIFFNFFSVGWRTLPFLKIITFDIHFNWFLFAVSAWFDFVYFPTSFIPDHPFSEKLNKKFFIPMFLFSFVFDAVSFCVNFKVDDYFYITVNLSYVLQKIVGWFLCWRLGADNSSVAEMMCKNEPMETHNLSMPPQKGKNYDYMYDGIMVGGEVGSGIKTIKEPILKNVFTGANITGSMPPKINKKKEFIINNNIENNNINTNILNNSTSPFMSNGKVYSMVENPLLHKEQKKKGENNYIPIFDINKSNKKTQEYNKVNNDPASSTGIEPLGWDIDPSKFNQNIINMPPKVNIPSTNVPEVDVPKVEVHDMKIDINAPKIDVPKVDVPVTNPVINPVININEPPKVEDNNEVKEKDIKPEVVGEK